jgi:integrase/recombinase XerD
MKKMDNLFEEFINERKYFRNLSERTLRFYRETYHYFKQVGAFDNLSKQSLQNAIVMFRERGASVGGINAYIRGVNTFLKWLHEEHNHENLSLKKLKNNQRIMRSLTDAELKTIVRYKPKSSTEKRLHVVLMLMIDTGLRINEALTLQRQKIDFENLLLSIIGKGDKERIVPFSFELRKILYKYSASHKFDLLFCTGNGCKVGYRNILRDFNKLVEKLKIEPDGAFHGFRRTFATNYIRSGGNPLVLQRLLGHSSLQQTTLYVKLVTEDLQKEQHRTSLLNRIR